MCGFACVIAKTAAGFPAEDSMRRMGGVLHHRGPDESGVVVRDALGMAHQRLSIIDLEGGSQPMTTADGSVWVSFNGEIYNFPDLTRELRSRGRVVEGKSDTEVLLHAYLEWGKDCVHHLNGMFAFVLYDARSGEGFAARDRFGEKPLYIHETDEAVTFVSELKSLLENRVLTPELDPVALYNYFTCGYVFGPRTIFKGVRRLPAGHALSVRNGEVREWSYWSPPPQTGELTDPEEASREALDLLRDSVRLRLVSDVPIGFFLSGGIDSSAVVALASEVTDSRLETFSIGFEEPRYDERPFARDVAAQFGTRHHEFLLRPESIDVVEELAWHLDEPFADSSALPVYFLSRLTREHVKVALSGDGGDEVFAGYDVYKGHVLSEWVRRLGPLAGTASQVCRALASVSGDRRESWERLARNLNDARLPAATRFMAKQQMIFRSRDLSRMARIPLVENARRSEEEMLAAYFGAGRPPLEAIADWQSHVSLVDDMLVKVDRMSMAHSLEVRAPFLDHRIVELTRRIPFSVKVPRLKTKFILKNALRRYFSDEFLWRSKQGFVVPLNYWFQEDLVGYARDALLSDRSLVSAVFGRSDLARILGEQESGRNNRGPAIWAMIMFEAWAKRFGIGRESLGDWAPD